MVKPPSGKLGWHKCHGGLDGVDVVGGGAVVVYG
jgi:hypothetical protein